LTPINDIEPNIKAHCIDLLTKIHSRPKAELFDKDVLSCIASDNSSEVQKAILEYFSQNGVSEDLEHIEKLLKAATADLNHIGERAVWSIKSRTNLKDAFAELLSMESIPTGTLSTFVIMEDQIPPELLQRGLAHGDLGIRILAARALMERKVLSKDVAFTLLNQDSRQLRALAYMYLISLGERFSAKQIKEALRESQSSQNRLLPLSSLLEGVDTDSVLYCLFTQYTYEDLLKEIKWYSIAGPIAYQVMAERFFKEASERIRKDLDERFETLREQYFSSMIPSLEKSMSKELRDLPVSVQEEAIKTAVKELREGEDQDLRESVRRRYVAAALSGIVSHCEPQDLQIARRYLTESRPDYYGNVEANAVKIIARLGDLSDVPPLVSLAQQMHGRAKQILLKTALALSPETKELAYQLLQDDSPDIFELGINSLTEVGDAERKSILEKVLFDNDALKRKRAVALLAETCTREELQQLLEKYIERNRYFYNVVCWLDRHLFAAEPLRQIYAEQLRSS
jgi:gas vesicle protein